MSEEALDISSKVLAMRRVSRTPLDDKAATNPAGVPEGVETYSLFVSKPHPVLQGVEVTTGTKYRTDEHPRYLSAWCYTTVKNNGATILVEIGTKVPYRDVEWPLIPKRTLEAAGISREQAEAGRRACQFPSDAI
jgi:hypothetical protein